MAPHVEIQDFDNDGRLDLFLVNWFGGRGSVLLRNGSPRRRWLDVQVVGKTVNRMGIGSQMRLFAAGKLAGFQEVIVREKVAANQLLRIEEPRTSYPPLLRHPSAGGRCIEEGSAVQGEAR